MKCQCNYCKKLFYVDDKFVGKNVSCPNCKNTITIQEYIELTLLNTDSSHKKTFSKFGTPKQIIIIGIIIIVVIFLGTKFSQLIKNAQTQARTVSSMANLKYIGIACLTYADLPQWKGMFPANKYNSSEGGIYLMAINNTINFDEITYPSDIDTVDGILYWLIDNYAYIGSGFNENDMPNIPIAIEYPQQLNKLRKNVNILFRDGRVLNFNFAEPNKLTCADVIKTYILNNEISEHDAAKLMRNAKQADKELNFKKQNNYQP